MAHLRGNEWRKSSRAIDKKNRAKAKHTNSTTEHGVDYIQNENAERGIVVGSVLGKISLLHDDVYIECSVDKNAPKNTAKVVLPGDVVTLDSKEDGMFVTGITERRNMLARMRRDATRRSLDGAEEQPIAANIDYAVVVASAQNPPFHPKFIDRYMILLQHSGIAPVVCLNKIDLATDEERARLTEYERFGIKTITTSTVTNEGIEEFKDLLRGKVAVLVGHSGVGKTSLINSVKPSATYRTGEVSEKTGKGRHTTTASSLYRWDESSYIIDTPGIRSLEVWNIEKTELHYYYPEFETFIPNCRYSDCLHSKEPIRACAVKQALSQPDGVSQTRYESYIKILNEL